MDPEIRVEFILTGTKITPDEITNLLGITPTKTWEHGEPIKGTILRRKYNGWCFSIENEKESLDLMDYIQPLVDSILPKSELITRIIKEYELVSEISCGIYIVEQTPIFHFDPEIMAKLVKINTEVDIDIILTD